MKRKKSRRCYTEKVFTCRLCGREQKFYLCNIIDISTYKMSKVTEIIECPSCGWKWWIITKNEKKIRSLLNTDKPLRAKKTIRKSVYNWRENE